MNNYEELDLQNLLANDQPRYVVIGKEIGPENKIPHLQGYMEFVHDKTLSTLKKKINSKAHWESRLGTQLQAITYCKKDGDYYEAGEKKTPGKRSDLEAVTESIDAGQFDPSDFGVMYIKFHRGIDAYITHKYTDRETKPIVEWRHGLTGVGKTYGVMSKYDRSDIYIKDSTMWWNNYTQQKVILIDDFDGKWPFRDLLRLLDYNAYQGQYKGGYVKINSPYIYITCEFEPSHFWKHNELAQVLRRIESITYVSLSGETSEVAGNTVPPHQRSPDSI